MSAQEICRDASILLEPKANSAQPGLASTRYDFSFALQDAQFADCTLRVIAEDDPEENPPEEVSVSSIVLVAKSQYFKRMFTGSFREGDRRNVIEIRLSSEEKPFFMDLIRFVYTDVVPPEISSSFPNTLKLLVIADRFDTPDCISDCSAILEMHVAKLERQDALLLLSLPESLQQMPHLAAIMGAATTILVKEFSAVLTNGSEDAFMQLPETAVAVLMQAHDLKLSSEDVIVRAALAWICYHFADPQDRTDCLFRLILPYVRYQCLSPKQVLQLCAFIKDPTDWAVCHFQSSDACQVSATTSASNTTALSQPGTPPPAAVQFTELSPFDSVDSSKLATWGLSLASESPESGDAGAAVSLGSNKASRTAAEKMEAVMSALVAVSEHGLTQGGTIPRGASLDSCLTGQRHLPPRQSCRPPCSIFLDIPEKLCRDWQTSNEHLATSAPTCASGRWFTLQAKIYPSESTLHVQLSSEKRFPGGEFSSFQIELQLCLQTSESRPAYLQQTRKAPCRYTSASASFGCRDFLGKPLTAALEQSSIYFPEGALRLRADVWLVDSDAP